jgi:hypothetical protein
VGLRNWGGAKGEQKTGCYVLARQVSRILGMQAPRWGQDSQGSSPGDCLRAAVDTEFAGKRQPTCVAKALTLEIVRLPVCDYVR